MIPPSVIPHEPVHVGLGRWQSRRLRVRKPAIVELLNGSPTGPNRLHKLRVVFYTFQSLGVSFAKYSFRPFARRLIRVGWNGGTIKRPARSTASVGATVAYEPSWWLRAASWKGSPPSWAGPACCVLLRLRTSRSVALTGRGEGDTPQIDPEPCPEG